MFEDFFGAPEEGGLPDFWAQGRFVPAVDVAENDEGLTLMAEIPGVSKDELDVSFEDGVLTLRGEKKEEEKREGTGWHRVERRYGRFERRIRLPEYVDVDKITARHADGVLTLTMPKAERAKPKSIAIK
jgi:HSP20 family protein